MILINYTYITSPISEEIYAKYKHLLCTYDQRRIEGFIRKQSADATLAGRLLLLEAAKALKYSINLNQIQISSKGKPYLTNGPFFSISHSSDYVICATSTNEEIGIDIERKRPLSIEAFQRQFSETEWKRIMSSKHKNDELLKYWCTKEAFLKKIGQGLEVDMKEVQIEKDKVLYNNTSYYPTLIPFHQDYAGVLVTNNKPEYKIQSFNL
ncbi:4'-phosphopantetheinyl transferase family protein [Fulvivirga sediminis]|uniref:4'-phosphopantetheinyl transferase superfamily protein n=1 Tax=Fulvivirga sediminis TaxID=2803949 RepID=A0A937FCQ7_9BACT|nr:4'-phosphopantetheinyl transferase superfamily protein [Fulvivirga sediminis]MBL3658500.1 4'-phosphopantetheinyl transferase superfamily protein [Fulvivirga sediminis]